MSLLSSLTWRSSTASFPVRFAAWTARDRSENSSGPQPGKVCGPTIHKPGCASKLWGSLVYVQVPESFPGQEWRAEALESGCEPGQKPATQGRMGGSLLHFFPSSPRFNFLCAPRTGPNLLRKWDWGSQHTWPLRVHLLGIYQPRVHLALVPACRDVLGTLLLRERRAFVLKASMFIVMVTAPGFKLRPPCDKDNKGSFTSFWLSKPDLGDREATS